MSRQFPLLACALAALPLFVAPEQGLEAAQAGSMRANLCTADETILFQCRQGNRVAALCGRRTPVTQVRYRFGRPGQVEYSSPAGARFWWTPGEGVDMRFRDGEDEYSIYRRTFTRMTADGRYEDINIDGVRVFRGERLVSDRRCADGAHSNGPFQAYMPEGEEE